MKKLIPVFMLLPVAAAAQKSYVVSGKLSGLKEPAIAYLNYGKTKDSVEIKNGTFQFKGSVAEPVQAYLTVKAADALPKKNQDDYTLFWLENSKISVSGKDSIKNAAIKGSLAEKESREMDAPVKPLTDKILRLMKESDTKPGADRKRAISDSIGLLVKEIKNVRTKFAETHLNSYMGLYAYNLYVLDNYVDLAVAEPIFNRYASELRSSPLGLRTVEKIEAARRRSTGSKVTDFTQNDLADQPFTLSSLRGKYVLVDFWASWCKPCRAENPNLKKAYSELKGKNFEVVGVSLDLGKSAWEDAVKKDDLPWIHVSDLQGWKNAVAVKYGISAVPQNLLINPEGIIIAKNLRGEELTEKLRALIK